MIAQGAPTIDSKTAFPSRAIPLFFGESACIPRSSAAPQQPVGLDSGSDLSSLLYAELLSNQQERPRMSSELYNHLLHHFATHIHALYPILDVRELEFSRSEQARSIPSSSRDFTQNMICAISCASLSDQGLRAQDLIPLACNFYEKAMERIQDVTDNVSVLTLRSTALLALFSLFVPKQGNFTQLISLAARLCLDLGIQKTEDVALRKLYLSVICMERQVALTLDRPWLLPTIVSLTGRQNC